MTGSARTRTSLHAVAESLLAGHQYRTTGTIRLHVVPGGFSTGDMSGSPTRLAVDGGRLVVHDDAGVTTVELHGRSLGEIAEAVGISCAPPLEVYQSSTPSSDDVTVELDPQAVDEILDALSLGDSALRALASLRDDSVGEPVLWPEHFDVSVSVPGATVGVSPGDDYVDGPYAYVVPDTPQTGDFWNQPFGAARSVTPDESTDTVVQFFLEGIRRATGTSSP